MKFIKENKKLIIGFIIGIITASNVALAAYNYSSKDISYTTSKNKNIATAEDALNDLYSIATAVPTGTILSFSADKEVNGLMVEKYLEQLIKICLK